jgi:hypothetical protein
MCRTAVLVLATALAVAVVQAQPAEVDASHVLAEIAKSGAIPTFKALVKNGDWVHVLSGVETGESDWLRVAVAIHPATDAGDSEMLSLAAGVALAKHPQAVLSIWGSHDGVQGICGYPDLAEPQTNTPQKAVAYIDTRIHAVGKVSGPLAQECLKVLRRTRQEILSKDGPFG